MIVCLLLVAGRLVSCFDCGLQSRRCKHSVLEKVVHLVRVRSVLYVARYHYECRDY